MNIIPILNDGILKLTLNGRFDTFGAGPVQQVLDSFFNKHPKFIIMDMSGVDFISSAGIRVFLITAKEVEGRKGVLALVGLNSYCRELITTTHITGILSQFDTMDQAEAFCRKKTPPAT
ncbi:MAG: STAS domain-containing protein [Verrucomicrobia bacterium]|nr:STAS domain-containing protein [Verrucomicrobiota bacterium]MBU1735687.1 STAS domain-containing protein [Verrucomicrobiota bacterium]MBU1858090.1 STAS domain-containing protein [Verrucomicrobiota bacterium]